MYFDSDSGSSKRERLSSRMFEYYRNNEEYFDYVHADSEEGEERPNQEERRLYDTLIAHYQPRDADETTQVLELGCGSARSIGALLAQLKKSKFHGIEANTAAVKVAQAEHPDYDMQNGDIARLPFSAGSIDIVTLNYVLEHLPAPHLVIDEIFRVLRPGGMVGMLVPVCDVPWLLPRSLRYKSKDMQFTAGYMLHRWLLQMKLRYRRRFFAFENVEEPQVLVHPEARFEYDDDLVYNGSTLEITKYLRHDGFEIVSAVGRDIKPFIRNGKRRRVDLVRSALFAAYRCSLCDFNTEHYTTNVAVVARKTPAHARV